MVIGQLVCPSVLLEFSSDGAAVAPVASVKSSVLSLRSLRFPSCMASLHTRHPRSNNRCGGACGDASLLRVLRVLFCSFVLGKLLMACVVEKRSFVT